MYSLRRAKDLRRVIYKKDIYQLWGFSSEAFSILVFVIHFSAILAAPILCLFRPIRLTFWSNAIHYTHKSWECPQWKSHIHMNLNCNHSCLSREDFLPVLPAFDWLPVLQRFLKYFCSRFVIIIGKKFSAIQAPLVTRNKTSHLQ